MHHFTIVKKNRYQLVFQALFIILSFALAYLLSFYHYEQQSSELTKQNKDMLLQLELKQKQLEQLKSEQISLQQTTELFRKTNQKLESQYTDLNLSFNQLNNQLLFYKRVLQTDSTSKNIEIFLLNALPLDKNNLPVFIQHSNQENSETSWYSLDLTLINRLLSKRLLQVNIVVKLYMDNQVVDQTALLDDSGKQKSYIKFQQFIHYKGFFSAKPFNRLEVIFTERRKLFKAFTIIINQDNSGHFNYVSEK